MPRPRRAAALGLALTMWLLPLALGAAGPASGLFVNILGPSEGSWTANASTNLWGTVGALGNSTQLLDSPAELGAGTLLNTTLETGAVALEVPQTEGYGYFQDFTGLVGLSRIDRHWPAKISDTAWAVSSSASAGASPPALVHTGTLNEKVFWTVVLPGPLVNGSLAFKYGCEANGNLTVAVSTSGFGPNEVTLVTTGSRAQTAFNTSLTPTFAGASSFFVRASARATNASASACSIDDFEFFAEFVPSTANPTFTFFDDFALGLNAAWDLSDGRWSVSGPTDMRGTSDPPGLLHIGSQRTSAFLNLAFAAPIRNATLSLDYKTNYYGRVAAYLGGDGASEGLLLADDGSYLTPTTFSMDVTSVLQGGHSLRLRIDGSATMASWNESGIDDVRIQVETDGAFVEGYEGGYTSTVLDAAVQVTLDAVTWSAGVPAGAWIGFYVRASADGLAYTGFQPVAGNGTSPLAAPYRFFQMRANMTAPAASAPVRLEWLSIRYHGIAELAWSAEGGPWNSLPLQSPWSVQAPLAGGANTFTVRARDTTGALAERRVNVSRDVFAPGPPGTPQGPPITAAVSATWTWAAAADTGLGVDHYIVDAGTTPGGNDLVAGQPIDGTAYTIGVLPEVATVYFRVSAVDRAGLLGPASAVSEPTLVDRVPPGGFAFRGPGPYINASEVLFNWSEPNEVGSWVAYYIVLVGTAAGSANVADSTSNETAFAVSGLESGRRYYATAMAVDAAGNIGPLVTSGGTLVDLDAPGPPGSLTVLPEWTNEAAFGWSWTAAADALTGIRGYRVRLGSDRGLSDVLTTEVAERAYTFATGEDGHAYFVAVAALDLAGNEGPPVSGGPVRVDRSPPPAVTLPTFGAFVREPALSVDWPPPADLPATGASGVERYDVTIVEGGSPRTTSRSANYTQLSLRDGVAYELRVAAVDRAGNRGADAVLAFTTDMSGPAAPLAVGLEGATAGGQMTVQWEPSHDSASGVAGYRVKVGTQRGGDDVMAARALTGTSITFPAETGKDYFLTVWGVDAAGNEGSPAEAGPFRVQSPSSISVTTPAGLLLVLAAAGAATGGAGVAVRVLSRRRAKARKRAR